ncbi:MAG TPA: hypothetical protein VHE99_03060 [Gammaproteobacteria bacterium]|nr:hypothetical protein [Gammaproteobacteria bacterium]
MIVLVVSSSALAQTSHTTTTVGRYLSVDNKPTSAQRDLLSQIIQVRFPQPVQTIGDAMNYLLRFSGYSLVDETRQSIAMKNTLKKPLPLVDRSFGPMSLKDGLITLAGPAFTLMQDPLNREINFKLKPGITWHKG